MTLRFLERKQNSRLQQVDANVISSQCSPLACVSNSYRTKTWDPYIRKHEQQFRRDFETLGDDELIDCQQIRTRTGYCGETRLMKVVEYLTDTVPQISWRCMSLDLTREFVPA